MEPMTLGSPGSPSSPPGVSSPFLPSYLMGDLAQASNSPLSNKSPSRLVRHLSFNAALGGATPQQASTPIYAGTPTGPRDSVPRPERASGPPTRGLFDEPINAHFDNSLYSHANTSVFATEPMTCSDGAADCWVTVFGFPPSAASVVLARFASFGRVVESRLAARGNWLHARYSARSEARRALACNGRLFGDAVMIGVVPCTDQDIVSAGQQKENVMFSGQADTPRPSHGVPLNNTGVLDASNRSVPAFMPATPGNQASFSVTSPGGARQLAQAYRNAQHDTEVVMARNTPHKSTSMVSKAWEFLGW